MPIAVKFSPQSLSFGAIGAGGRHSGTVTIGSTPSSATVNFSITEDNSGGLFKIISVRVFDIERDPQHPNQIVDLTLVDESDGSTPVAVDRDQRLTVRIDFFGPVLPPTDIFSATLFIKGKSDIPAASWGVVKVPMSVLAGQVDTILLQPSITIAQGEQGDLPILVASHLGPDTVVSFQLFPQMGISLAPTSVPVLRGQTVPAQLHLTVAPNAPLGSHSLSIFARAFNSLQSDLIKPEPVLTVIPGQFRDDSIHWELASPSGILLDEASGAWHAGCVRDVLPMAGDNVLAASDTGGVWSLNSSAASCLVDWDQPDLVCLAAGSRSPQHVYAGGVALHETDISSGFPLGHWREIPLVDTAHNPIRMVLRIAVLRQPARVVLACSNGVYWSPVPEEPHGAYRWKKAVFERPFANQDSPFYGLAVTGEASVAVASWGTSKLATTLFFGEWRGDDLVFVESRVEPGLARILLRATSIASCDSQPQHVYAVGSNEEGFLVLMLRSHDRGRTWAIFQPMLDGGHHKPLEFVAGNEGNYTGLNFRANNCIAVHPRNPNLVAVGWRYEGAFISLEPDRDDSWRQTETNAHFHSDIHSIRFDPFSETETRLYLGSDGGVVGFTVDSRELQPKPIATNSGYNRRLANLQFQDTSSPQRSIFGTLSASARKPGLVGGGLQDNGEVFALLESSSPEWSEYDGGDGQLVQFLASGQVLRYNNTLKQGDKEVGNRVRVATIRDRLSRWFEACSLRE